MTETQILKMMMQFTWLYCSFPKCFFSESQSKRNRWFRRRTIV